LLRRRNVSQKHTQKKLKAIMKEKFGQLDISGIYLPMPLLEKLSKQKYRIIYKLLIELGKVIPQLAMFICLSGERLNSTS